MNPKHLVNLRKTICCMPEHDECVLYENSALNLTAHQKAACRTNHAEVILRAARSAAHVAPPAHRLGAPRMGLFVNPGNCRTLRIRRWCVCYRSCGPQCSSCGKTGAPGTSAIWWSWPMTAASCPPTRTPSGRGPPKSLGGISCPSLVVISDSDIGTTWLRRTEA